MSHSVSFSTAGGWSFTALTTGVHTVVVEGPQGGAGTNSASNGGAAGLGGEVQGSFSAASGDTISGTIGGAGVAGASGGTAGSNGGGAAGSSPARVGGGGGGLTDLKLNGTTYIIAGGGGGGGSGGNAGGGTTLGGAGGAGGGTTAVNGSNGAGGAGLGHGGGGGSTSGGAGGTGGSGADGSAGTSLHGGAGAGGVTTTSGGGGGGAGFFGGGGGEQGAAINGAGGAGGGSSWTHASVSGVTHTQGHRSGDGIVTITYTVEAAYTGAGSSAGTGSGSYTDVVLHSYTGTGISAGTGSGSYAHVPLHDYTGTGTSAGTGSGSYVRFLEHSYTGTGISAGTGSGSLVVIVPYTGTGISHGTGVATLFGFGTSAPVGVYMPEHDRTLVLEISQSDALAEDQEWRNISQYLLGSAGNVGGELTYEIGVDPNTGQFSAGTMSLYVDNTDGVFDTRNTASPFAACLQARRQIRLRTHPGPPGTIVEDFYDDTYTDLYEGVGRGILDSDLKYLFRGFVNRWPRFYGIDNQFSWVQIKATDGSLILNQSSTSDGFFTLDDDTFGLLDGIGILATSDDDPDTPESHRLSGELVRVVLDAVEWPQDLRDIDDGRILVGHGDTNGSSLASLSDAAAAEQGEVFFWPDGRVAFYDRLWEWAKPRSVTVQAIFGTSGLPFSDINGIGPDDQDIASTWRRTGLSGVEQVRQNADAKDRWGRVTDGPTSVTTVRDVDVISQLDYLEARHGMRVEKIEELVIDAMLLDPATHEPMYEQAIALQPFDRVAVNFAPPNGAPYPTYPGLALQLSTTIGSASWVTTARLGPAATETLFALDDSLLDGDSVTAP